MVGLAALLLAALSAGSCSTGPQLPDLLFDFHMETPAGSGMAFTLPATQQVKYCKADAFVTEANVLDVKGGTIDVPLGDNEFVKTRCVFFYFDREGERQVELHTTTSDIGKKIYLFVNAKPVGARLIDQTISIDESTAAPIDVTSVASAASAALAGKGAAAAESTSTNGALFMFLEIPDVNTDQAKFDDYVADLKKSVVAYQKFKKSQ
jgi:hypothetical protein